MTCHMTDPTRIAGSGTGRLIVRLEVTPPTPCDCGAMRMTVKVISIIEALGLATIEFRVNDSEPQYGTFLMGGTTPVVFEWECPGHDIIFEWRMVLPDEPETYAVGDLWHWEQVMD